MPEYKIRVLAPSQLPENEFASAKALIIEGGEVDTTHLDEYLRSSLRVAVTETEGQFVCVGAIKRARPDYVRTISSRSGYRLDGENCVGEFGYVVTKPAFRKRGLAKALSAELLRDLRDPLYATTRDDNISIHSIARDNGFRVVGNKWASTQHAGASIILWLRS